MKHVFCSAIIVFLLFVDILLAITFGWVRQAFGGVSMEELIFHLKVPLQGRLNSDKVLFSIARGRERCDRNGHAVFLRPGVDFATTSSETTGISTSSTKLK